MEKRPMPQRGPDGRFLPQGQPAPKTRKPPLMNKCSVLLKHLMSHKYAYVFNEPVDPVKLGVPDYFTVIESPMDLGTIRAKLRASRYSSAEEFAADVRLTFSNALKYNHPGDVVHEMAKTLSKRFENRWKVIGKRTKQRARVRVRDRVGARDRGAPGDGVMPQMTYEKMYYIVRRFMEWPGDIPEVVVDFVKRHGAAVMDDSDELQLDLNALSNDRMWELHGLVSRCLEDCDLRPQPEVQNSDAQVLSMLKAIKQDFSLFGRRYMKEQLKAGGKFSGTAHQ
ncbi:transcription factor GTE8 [Cryptomeria japonica]|uniref:transcription factor GTE8 n=1 Tax=Cryptomeria japonica TaxID=3369 RepID=UPI0025AD7DE7|nr:transcription factor GTE8 [Cryptomeria japonica]